MLTINQRILKIMENQGITQKQLSTHINIPANTLNNWLKQNRKIPADLVIPISEFLHITPYFLLTGTEQLQSVPMEDAEWLNMIHELPKEKQYELKGYIKRMLEESRSLDSSFSKAN